MFLHIYPNLFEFLHSEKKLEEHNALGVFSFSASFATWNQLIRQQGERQSE